MTIPIPFRMRKFTTWHGYPIHYTVLVRPDGTPNFRSMDEHRRIECFEKNLCHLCGEKLRGGPFAFIGGPNCVEAHRFIDGPMHEECAVYAAKACPFLSAPTGRYSPRPLDKGIYQIPDVGNVRPPKMGLVLAASYRTETNPGLYRSPYRGEGTGVKAVEYDHPGQIVCVAGEYLKVDWDLMPQSAGEAAPVDLG